MSFVQKWTKITFFVGDENLKYEVTVNDISLVTFMKFVMHIYNAACNESCH